MIFTGKRSKSKENVITTKDFCCFEKGRVSRHEANEYSTQAIWRVAAIGEPYL